MLSVIIYGSLGLVTILWVLALIFRDRIWAFAGWWPFPIIFTAGLLAGLNWIPMAMPFDVLERLSAATPGTAVMVGVFTVICAIIVYLSVRFRPMRYRWWIVLLTVLITPLLLYGLYVLRHELYQARVHLVIKTKEGEPLPGLIVQAGSEHVKGYHQPEAFANGTTNENGMLSFWTRTNQITHVRVLGKGDLRMYIKIEPVDAEKQQHVMTGFASMQTGNLGFSTSSFHRRIPTGLELNAEVKIDKPVEPDPDSPLKLLITPVVR